MFTLPERSRPETICFNQLEVTSHGGLLFGLGPPIPPPLIPHGRQELLLEVLKGPTEAGLLPVVLDLALAASLVAIITAFLLVLVELSHQLRQGGDLEGIKVVHLVHFDGNTDPSGLGMDAEGRFEQVILHLGNVDIETRICVAEDGFDGPLLDLDPILGRQILGILHGLLLPTAVGGLANEDGQISLELGPLLGGSGSVVVGAGPPLGQGGGDGLGGGWERGKEGVPVLLLGEEAVAGAGEDVIDEHGLEDVVGPAEHGVKGVGEVHPLVLLGAHGNLLGELLRTICV